MPDQQKTDAEFQKAADAWGIGLRASRSLEDFARRFDRRRTQLVPVMALNVLNWPHDGNTLTSVNYGVNTDDNGDVWLRITGAGPFTVSLYSASGASGLVAQGSGNADATITLTAQNSSGLSGSLRLPSSVVTVTSDVARIRILQDFTLEPLDIWDGTDTDDGKSTSAAERMFTSLANGIRALIVNGPVGTYFREIAISAGDNPKPQIREFLDSDANQLVGEQVNTDGSNNISRTEIGVWPEWKDAMLRNTGGSTQDIIQRVVDRAAGVFTGDGQGTIVSGTAEDRARLGTYTFEVLTGLGNNGGGSETFTGKFSETDSDFVQSFGPELRIGKTYALPFGGGTITLNRFLTKTGDGTNVNVGAASTFTFTGENEVNTDSGVVYGLVSANGPNWDIAFYSDSGRTALVAQATNVPASTSGAIASAQGGNGLTVVFDVGGTPVDTTQFSINLNYFRVLNTNNQKDRITMVTTETSAGATSRVLAQVWDAEWNGIASSPQLTDGPLAIQGVFAERMKDDI